MATTGSVRLPGLARRGADERVAGTASVPLTYVSAMARPDVRARRRPGADVVRHNGSVQFDERAVTEALRAAGACFGFVYGSRAAPGAARPDSDLDVAAWWGVDAPDAWDVSLPSGVDLLVLDAGPLWLVGRVAQYGRLLFDDDPAARVAWQADTRLRYLDERPGIERRYQERISQIARGAPGG